MYRKQKSKKQNKNEEEVSEQREAKAKSGFISGKLDLPERSHSTHGKATGQKFENANIIINVKIKSHKYVKVDTLDLWLFLLFCKVFSGFF